MNVLCEAAATMDLSQQLGQTIDDYEVNRLLGKGGFAQVYHAVCRKTGVEVAIKVKINKLINICI